VVEEEHVVGSECSQATRTVASLPQFFGAPFRKRLRMRRSVPLTPIEQKLVAFGTRFLAAQVEHTIQTRSPPLPPRPHPITANELIVSACRFVPSKRRPCSCCFEHRDRTCTLWAVAPLPSSILFVQQGWYREHAAAVGGSIWTLDHIQ
jgi:hypothetical protein